MGVTGDIVVARGWGVRGGKIEAGVPRGRWLRTPGHSSAAFACGEPVMEGYLSVIMGWGRGSWQEPGNIGLIGASS